MDPLNATEWNSSDLRPLMDPSEANIGASVFFDCGDLPLAVPGDRADVDVVREVVPRDHNAYL